MGRMVWSRLRARGGRASALALGIIVAITGFTVLTGATRTSRLAVTGTVATNSLAAYDVLVRPAGAGDQAELSRGLVRPNALTGQYGGITVDQWAMIARLPGVTVAAPVAMIGYVSATATVVVDLTRSLDPNLTDQLIRIRPTWSGDAGLTRATEPEPRFVYVTRHTIGIPTPTPEGLIAPDGRLLPAAALLAAGCDWREVPYPYVQRMDDGSWRPICGTWFLDNPDHAHYSVLNQAQFFVVQALPGGRFLDFRQVGAAPDVAAGTTDQPQETDRVVFRIAWPLWLGLAAIDPTQEARLVGLDRAVVTGQYFPPAQQQSPGHPLEAPVLVTSRSPVAESLTVATDRLTGAMAPGVPVAGRVVAGVTPRRLLAELTQATGTASFASSYQASDLYAAALADPGSSIRLDISLAALAPTYVAQPSAEIASTRPLVPVTVPVDPASWATPVSSFGELATGAAASEPYLATDVGFRALEPTRIAKLTDIARRPTLDRIGIFDPARIASFSPLSAVPLETYRTPPMVGGDASTRALLHDGPLLPTNNPAGYLAAPPSALMTLADAQRLTGRSDLISAIRVRVAGVTGADPVSRERVRLVAEQIASQTGLHVDITVGSSPRAETVVLPAGRYGRPTLTLSEGWTQKGVAAAIISAVDRKSVALFGLVVLVCVLFVANATSAAVRERSRELALLSCLGWPAWRRSALVLAEVAIIGLAAGAVSAIATGPIAAVLGVAGPRGRGLLAIPVAVVIALLAGLAPALRAGRSHPAVALHPPTVGEGWAPKRSRGPGRRLSLARLAGRNLLRAPGRTFTGVAALAVAVAALTLLAALLWAFDGTVLGTLLGDVVSLRARQVDIVAVVATAVLAIASVIDVLYLGVRERAHEFAVLRATGWTEADLARLVLTEGAGLAVLGTVLGSGVGLTGTAVLANEISARLLATTALVGVAALIVTLTAAFVLAVLLGRQPTSALLAEE